MSVNTYDKDTKETTPVAGSAKITLDSEPTQGSNNAVSSGGVYNTVQNLNSKGYQTSDSSSTTINDTDYIPMSETDGTKKKTLWSTIIAKIKAALNSVRDIGNNTETTFAYSKAGLGYSDYSWLAGWNGYELRAVNKAQFAPKSHASTGTGYGAGNASNYGHVKLSDEFDSNVGAAANSIGASQNAVYQLASWHLYSNTVTLDVTNVNSNVNIEGKGYGKTTVLYSHASFNSHLVHLKFSMNVSANIGDNTQLFTLKLSQYVYNDNNYSKILYAQNIGSVIGQIEFRATGMSNVDSFDVYSAGGVNAGDYINVEATFIRRPKFTARGN